MAEHRTYQVGCLDILSEAELVSVPYPLGICALVACNRTGQLPCARHQRLHGREARGYPSIDDHRMVAGSIGSFRRLIWSGEEPFKTLPIERDKLVVVDGKVFFPSHLKPYTV